MTYDIPEFLPRTFEQAAQAQLLKPWGQAHSRNVNPDSGEKGIEVDRGLILKDLKRWCRELLGSWVKSKGQG